MKRDNKTKMSIVRTYPETGAFGGVLNNSSVKIELEKGTINATAKLNMSEHVILAVSLNLAGTDLLDDTAFRRHAIRNQRVSHTQSNQCEDYFLPIACELVCFAEKALSDL